MAQEIYDALADEDYLDPCYADEYHVSVRKSVIRDVLEKRI
jgi:hypothetical protein